jgi:23S rRNA (cytosine1962-C5)-methyltransferase
MEDIILRKGRERAVARKHPWIFSRGIYSDCSKLKDGDHVRISNAKDEVIGVGHFQHGSIAVRMLAWRDVAIDQAYYNDRVKQAYELRMAIGVLTDTTNTYRLIHGEGDHLPGLIVDVYHDTVVIQCHSIGMYRDIDRIKAALQATLGDAAPHIYCKSQSTLPKNYDATDADRWLDEARPMPVAVSENSVSFNVNVETGQKTGFFLDQRHNRELLRTYSKGKSILNCFCYTGGFSLYALDGGAQSVTSIDVSAKAMAMLQETSDQGGYGERHHLITANVLEHLTENSDDAYDIVVIDPPAFAKRINKRHNAIQAYKRLNTLAIANIKKGGLLFTFSCSQVVDHQMFYDTVVAACIESGREARIIHRLSQGPDHPVNAFHNEGSYLKGLVLYIS